MMSHKDHRHAGLPVNTPYDGIYSMLGFVENNGKILERFKKRSFFVERGGYVKFKNMDKY